MKGSNWYDGSCEVINAFSVISGRWKLPILWRLSLGKTRYNELKRQVRGITNIMLTRSLQELQSHGLVERIQHSLTPPHVEYGLTEHGRKLIPGLTALRDWAKEQAELERTRP